MTGRPIKFASDMKRYPREAYFFIAASFVNAAGSAFMWPLTVIYVHQVLHRSYGEAGFVLLMQSLAGVVGQFAGGALYHRLGAKVLINSSLTLTGLAQLSLVFGSSWPVYIALMSMCGFLMAVTMPVINAFIGFQWPEHRSSLFNVVYVSNNVGMAIGTTLGGVLASVSFACTFLVNGLSTLAFAVFFAVFLRSLQTQDSQSLTTATSVQRDPVSYRTLLCDYRVYLFVALGSMMTWFSTCEYGSGIAPYLTDRGMSPASYSFLWTVNGIVILAGQPLTSLLCRTLARTLQARLVASAVCYTLGFSYILVFHAAYVHLIVGMVFTTFGEMLIAPTTPALVTETTGAAAPFYLGVVGGFGSLGRLLGPYVYGHMYDRVGLTPACTLTTVTTCAAVVLFVAHCLLNRQRGPARTSSTQIQARDA